MKKSFIAQNGQINMTKTLLYAIIFSLSIGFFVKWIDTYHYLFIKWAPFFSISVMFMTFLQVYILIRKEIMNIAVMIRDYAIWTYVQITSIHISFNKVEVVTCNQCDINYRYTYQTNSTLRC